jgi:hypothetical protein
LLLCWISFDGVQDLPLDGDDLGFVTAAGSMLEGTVEIFSSGRTFSGRPVIELVFLGAYTLWGEEPAPYHVLAVLLHFCAAMTISLALERFGRPRIESMLAGAFFLVGVGSFRVPHWVACIPYPIVLILGILATLAFSDYLKTRKTEKLILALLAIVIATFTHPSAVAFSLIGPALVWLGRYPLRFLHFPSLCSCLVALSPSPWFGFSMAMRSPLVADQTQANRLSWAVGCWPIWVTHH